GPRRGDRGAESPARGGGGAAQKNPRSPAAPALNFTGWGEAAPPLRVSPLRFRPAPERFTTKRNRLFLLPCGDHHAVIPAQSGELCLVSTRGNRGSHFRGNDPVKGRRAPHYKRETL